MPVPGGDLRRGGAGALRCEAIAYPFQFSGVGIRRRVYSESRLRSK